jgi:hypothetical protein
MRPRSISTSLLGGDSPDNLNVHISMSTINTLANCMGSIG